MSSKPGGYSQAIGGQRGCRKAAGIRRLFTNFDRIEFRGRLEPLGAPATVIPARPAIAVVAMIPIIAMIPVTAITIPVAVTFMVPPALVAKMREHLEATLLAVVEGLVERVGGIRDTLQHGRRGRHPVGAFAQARHRIIRLLRIAC